MNSIMEPSITVNGPRKASETARASRFGRMAASMKATGRMTRPTGMVDSYTPMETVTMVTG